MSDFGIETPGERRARYMRLARAATEAAEKSPMPSAKEMYVKLAQAWVAMADDNNGQPNISEGDAGHLPDLILARGLNVKLNGMP